MKAELPAWICPKCLRPNGDVPRCDNCAAKRPEATR